MNIFITEDPDSGQPPIDIYSKLARDRILFIGNIDDKEASDIMATLILKDLEDPVNKITLVINSMGGDIRNIFMVYDILQMIQAPVETICVGDAMDEAVLLLAAGTKGMRYATPNAVICPNQLVQDKYMQANLDNAKDMLARITRDNKNLMAIYAKITGKKAAVITKDLDKQQYLDAKQAVAYGWIDKVVG